MRWRSLVEHAQQLSRPADMRRVVVVVVVVAVVLSMILTLRQGRGLSNGYSLMTDVRSEPQDNAYIFFDLSHHLAIHILIPLDQPLP